MKVDEGGAGSGLLRASSGRMREPLFECIATPRRALSRVALTHAAQRIQGSQQRGESKRKSPKTSSMNTASITQQETSREASHTLRWAKCCMQVATRIENENFHEQALLSLMKRWYKPI